MLVALGWMLFAGSPLLGPTPAHIALAAAPRVPTRAGGRVALWTDRDEPYRRGQGARVYLHTDQPAHVTVFRVDTDGRLRVLFPGEPWGDTYVRGGRDFEVTGARGGRSFIVDDYPGMGYLFAIASASPFEYADITRGDYWDYRLIDGGRIQGDPYVLLTDLAARITRDGNYDYDIVPYHVGRRYDYPRFVCYDCHAYASYDEWNPYERACSQFRVIVYDDPRYYPYRYNRGRNVVLAERPHHPGPRYVFRDADPRSDYVTRLRRQRGGGLARTSEDVGGQGSVPAPGVRSLGREELQRREPPIGTLKPQIEERRRRKPAAGERRLAPQERPARPPKSTGEPELRRRRE